MSTANCRCPPGYQPVGILPMVLFSALCAPRPLRDNSFARISDWLTHLSPTWFWVGTALEQVGHQVRQVGHIEQAAAIDIGFTPAWRRRTALE